MIKTNKYRLLTLALALPLLWVGGCKKMLPTDVEPFSPKATYTTTTFMPVLGRTTVFTGIFNPDNSGLPFDFKIVNVRTADGRPSDAPTKTMPVLVWKKGYTGRETSIAEIEAKREMEAHPLWEIRPKSGEFILWQMADSILLKQQPDSGYLFDVEVRNPGGGKDFKNLRLMPYPMHGYDPYEFDFATGVRKKEKVDDIEVPFYNHPGLENVVDVATEKPMKTTDVRVYFNRKGDGNSISFKFYDKDSIIIDPAKFNLTKWDELMHGFNKKQTAEQVTYDVAFPVPLVKLITKYTTGDGSSAAVRFGYDRIGFGGFRQSSFITYAFNLYQKGDWEMVIHFKKSNPKLQND
jgi:hypothetical protein